MKRRQRTVSKRPRILLILFLLVFGQAAMFLTYCALYLLNGMAIADVVIPEIYFGTFRFSQEMIAYLLLTSTWLVLGLASALIGVGLRRGKSWAWTAAIILQGAILILGLEAYFTRNADSSFYVALGLASAIVLTLNQREVLVVYRANRATLAE
ncbi:MAG: hypothetical protein HZB17_02390 [Chloroflexi bacterium]|nr:hypothetical protein [Chloroflexota bacterium]MBI5350565.1 hypothetical protein [Chloroflexota bacterium]